MIRHDYAREMREFRRRNVGGEARMVAVSIVAAIAFFAWYWAVGGAS